MRTHVSLAALSIALAGTLSVRAANPRTFTVDPQRSHALIQVGKGGMFSFAGHLHEVEAPIASGVVHLDPDDLSHADVRLEFNAAAMRVTGKGEPPNDVPKVQEVMLSDQVLDVRRYPTITLASTAVSSNAAKAAGQTAFDLTIAGTLSIHGATRPFKAPVGVRLDGATLTATGRLSIKQTDFGIKPISVGGVVNVKDALDLSFEIVARER